MLAATTVVAVSQPAGATLWAGGVNLTINNWTWETFTVQDVMNSGPEITVGPGEHVNVYGARHIQQDSGLNFSIARIKTSHGTFTVEGMNGMLGEPSVVVDRNNDRAWSAGYFSVNEAKRD